MKKKILAIMAVSCLVAIAILVIAGFFVRIENPIIVIAIIVISHFILLANIFIGGHLLFKKNEPLPIFKDYTKYHTT